MSDFGKKGGTSATANKRSAIYEATAPDGTLLKKRSFHTGNMLATMIAYQHEGAWYANCVYPSDQIPTWAKDCTKLSARRVK